MIDVRKFLLEIGFDAGQLAESEISVEELPRLQLLIDERIDQIVDGILVDVFQATRGSLHGIGHHNKGLLLGGGCWARIGEGLHVGLGGLGMQLLIGVPEVACMERSVVRPNELHNGIGQPSTMSDANTLCHMPNNNTSTLLGRQTIVRIGSSVLVLGVEHGHG